MSSQTTASVSPNPQMQEDEDPRIKLEIAAGIRDPNPATTATATAAPAAARASTRATIKTSLCSKINAKYFLDFENENFQLRPPITYNESFKKNFLNYLKKFNYNISEPFVKYMENLLGTENSPAFLQFLNDEIAKNDQEKRVNKRPLYTLKLIKGTKPVDGGKIFYNVIFDNSDPVNDVRNGFTELGEKYNKFFKEDNNKYISTDMSDIEHCYDDLEDLQFNYKYWQDICEQTQTSICLFSGPTTAFKYKVENNVDPAYDILEKHLLLNYHGKKSANIFISCENVCLAAGLNKQSYIFTYFGSTSGKAIYNLPCIGFDDLVVTYNSNIIFCRSLLYSYISNLFDNIQAGLNAFGLPNAITLNSNKKCDKFSETTKDRYEFFGKEKLANLVPTQTIIDTLPNLPELGQEYKTLRTQKLQLKDEIKNTTKDPTGKAIKGKLLEKIQKIDNQLKNLLKDKLLPIMQSSFFNSEKIKRDLIEKLINEKLLNANKFRVRYKNIFLASNSCNECSKTKLIDIINQNNNTRNNPLEYVLYSSDNGNQTRWDRGDIQLKVCTTCGNQTMSRAGVEAASSASPPSSATITPPSLSPTASPSNAPSSPPSSAPTSAPTNPPTENNACNVDTRVENIMYEVNINYKIYASLLLNSIENTPENSEKKTTFYDSLNQKRGTEEFNRDPKKIIDDTFLENFTPLNEILLPQYERFANTEEEVKVYDKIWEKLKIPLIPFELQRSRSADFDPGKDDNFGGSKKNRKTKNKKTKKNRKTKNRKTKKNSKTKTSKRKC